MTTTPERELWAAELETAYGKALAQAAARDMARFKNKDRRPAPASAAVRDASSALRLLDVIRARPGITSQQAADVMRISRNRVTHLARTLKREGWITQTKVPGHGGRGHATYTATEGAE